MKTYTLLLLAQIAKEQERFQDLMRENILQHVYVELKFKYVWLVIRVDSKETALDIAQTLPFCSLLDINIEELITS